MKFGKAIKKIVALGASAGMLGATIIGATATADLSQYPGPFVKDGVFDGLFVVGESAATQDVLGAIDIATSLQYAAKTVTKVPTGEPKIIQEGDSKKIEKSSNVLEFDEQISSIQSAVTKSDLDILKKGEVSNQYGIFSYTQTINLPADGRMLYTVDPDDDNRVAQPYFVLGQGQKAYEYKVTFTPSLKSDIDDGELEDLTNRRIKLLGHEYTILKAENPSGDEVALTFMGGAVTDILGEGETKTYTIGEVKYEITLTYVGDDDKKAKFIVNDEVTDSLYEGDVYRLDDGSELGVLDVLPNEAGETNGADLVEFNLGANRLDIDENGAVSVGKADISSLHGNISRSKSGDKMYINSITISYTPTDDLYLPVGGNAAEKAKEIEDEKGIFLLNGFDYSFEGLQLGDTETVELKPSGSNNYVLKFTNKNGDDYSANVFGLDNSDDFHLGRWTGSAMKDLVIDETAPIDDEEYFVLSKNEYSRIMQFKEVKAGLTTDNTGTIKTRDIGSGELIESTYSGLAGTISLDGNSYDFNVTADNTNADLHVDFNGDGDLLDTQVIPELYTDYGLKIELNNTHIVFTTENDEHNTKDILVIAMQESGGKADLQDHTSNMTQSEDGSYQYNTYTNYGMFVEIDEKGSGDTQNDLKIVYPDEQAFGAFFVNSGDVVTYISGEDIIEQTTITKIDVGAAVLDTDPAVRGYETEKNLIVVGGPAINKAAAVLLGLPFPSYGAASTIPENAAIIKLIEQPHGPVSLIVAGWNAQDTQRASRVLADYETYKDKLTGTEIMVSGTSMVDISVGAPIPVQATSTEEETELPGLIE